MKCVFDISENDLKTRHSYLSMLTAIGETVFSPILALNLATNVIVEMDKQWYVVLCVVFQKYMDNSYTHRVNTEDLIKHALNYGRKVIFLDQ